MPGAWSGPRLFMNRGKFLTSGHSRPKFSDLDRLFDLALDERHHLGECAAEAQDVDLGSSFFD
jgi:hypothetical protein